MILTGDFFNNNYPSVNNAGNFTYLCCMKKIVSFITFCLLVSLVFSFGGGKLLIQSIEHSTNEETILPCNKQGKTSVLTNIWDIFSGVSEEVNQNSLRVPAQSKIKQCTSKLLSFSYLSLKTFEVEVCKYRSPFLFLTCDYYVFTLRKILI